MNQLFTKREQKYTSKNSLHVCFLRILVHVTYVVRVDKICAMWLPKPAKNLAFYVRERIIFLGNEMRLTFFSRRGC